ncbi:MAG: Fatty acid desaturase (EC; Delta-9 fatty acid desaturase (EC [Candidatus Burkholderia crenata]|nr:MAG: Fatty acid desaturase (EC; Delta-9 fatty acid desaturase (EC [Candidatus Burkholderia crenata]
MEQLHPKITDSSPSRFIGESAVTQGPTNPGKRYAVSSPFLHKKQRRHFMLYDVLPAIGTLFAIWYCAAHPLTKLDCSLFLLMWCLTGFSLSVGFHRHFCHRSFKAHPGVRIAFVVFGCMAARSSMITWASQHRRHHQLADHDGDAHSPNLSGDGARGRLKGWTHAHFTWMWRHEYPNIVYYGSDLIQDKRVMRVDRYYSLWILVGLVVPAALGALLSLSWQGAFTGFLWGGVVRLFVVGQQISALNSLNHMVGTRPFKMSDNKSHNNALFGWLTWGEGWHNNHHAISSSASFSFRWYQVDPGYWLIRALQALGLVWDVQIADRERVLSLQKKLEEQTSRASVGQPGKFVADRVK